MGQGYYKKVIPKINYLNDALAMESDRSQVDSPDEAGPHLPLNSSEAEFRPRQNGVRVSGVT